MIEADVMNRSALAGRHVFFGLFCFLLVLLTFDSLGKLFRLSLNQESADYSHIILIPVISAALVFWDRQRIFRNSVTSLGTGAIVLATGVALYAFGLTNPFQLKPDDNLSVLTGAIIVVLFSGFLLFYGAETFKVAVFPLLFLGLAIPLPSAILDGLVKFLQHGSASVSALLFALTGTPVYRNDVSFMLPGVTITIAEECSGIRSTIGIFIVTLLAARLMLRSPWRRLILLAAVVPLSLVKNAIRIVTLTLLAVHVDMGFLTGNLHREGGIVFMMIGLVLLYPLLVFLIRSEAKLIDGVQS